MNRDKPEKKMELKDLPKQPQRTTTQQPEEFINDAPSRQEEPPKVVENEDRRATGEQETA